MKLVFSSLAELYYGVVTLVVRHTPYHQQVLLLAYDNHLAGHFGQSKSCCKVLHYYIPFGIS